MDPPVFGRPKRWPNKMPNCRSDRAQKLPAALTGDSVRPSAAYVEPRATTYYLITSIESRILALRVRHRPHTLRIYDSST